MRRISTVWFNACWSWGLWQVIHGGTLKLSTLLQNVKWTMLPLNSSPTLIRSMIDLCAQVELDGKACFVTDLSTSCGDGVLSHHSLRKPSWREHLEPGRRVDSDTLPVRGPRPEGDDPRGRADLRVGLHAQHLGHDSVPLQLQMGNKTPAFRCVDWSRMGRN